MRLQFRVERSDSGTERVGDLNGMNEAQDAVTVKYRNHRGEESYRRVQPLRIWFGATEWHAGRQWLMDVYDYGRNAHRTFAMRDVIKFDTDSTW